MIKNNLKLHDTFLVSVEILSANAIIVSANINSIIYRGALIQCHASVPCLFKNNKSIENSFSSKRLNATESKRNIRLKNFKSDYNLRRTNHKIIKAKQIVCKSELKEANEDFTLNHINLTESLSIKLKRLNGVYQNVDDLKKNADRLEVLKKNNECLEHLVDNIDHLKHLNKNNLEQNCLKNDIKEKNYPKNDFHDKNYLKNGFNNLHIKTKRKLSENSMTENKHNIIKIKKIKLHSDQYHYSISTEDVSKDKVYLPPLIEHSESVQPCFQSPPLVQLKDVPPLLSAAPLYPQLFSTTFCSRSPSTESISEPTQDFIEDFVALSESSDVTQLESKSSFVPKHINDGVLNTEMSSCNGSLTKLKIVKNSCNSYTIKSTDKNQESRNSISSRYNCKQFRKNDIIWAKLAGYSIWPAKVLDIDEKDHVIVLWLGSGHQTSRLHKRKLWDFGAHFHEKFNRKAKGNYLDAVEQARLDYGKLEFADSCQWHVDISSESSTLESVNIDDSCYEFDRSSGPDLRTNVYLPVAEEEYELIIPGKNYGKKHMESFLIDSPIPEISHSAISVADMNI